MSFRLSFLLRVACAATMRALPLQAVRTVCPRRAGIVFLLLAVALPRVCHGQNRPVGTIQPRLAWSSPAWAGAAPVLPLGGARSNGCRLTLAKDWAWSATVATLPVDLEATPVLAVNVTGLSPGAGWVIKLDDTPYEPAHPHELVPTPAGGGSPGRYLLDLREISGNAWRGQKQIELRLFVTGPPGASVAFSQVELLPAAVNRSKSANNESGSAGRPAQKPTVGTLRDTEVGLSSGAWTARYVPAKRRLQITRAAAAGDQTGGAGAVSVFLPGITDGKTEVVVAAAKSQNGTSERDAFTLRTATETGDYEARMTAYPPRNTGTNNGTVSLFRWTVTLRLRKPLSAADLRSVASPAGLECLYEPAAMNASDSPLPLRVLSSHRFGQVGQETGQAFLPCDPVLGGSVLYVQNLTALAPLFDVSHTSGTKSVSAGPEGFGFSPSPVTVPAPGDGAPQPAGTTLTLADSFLALGASDSDSTPTAAPVPQARQYIDLLATIYDKLPDRPATVESDWSALAERALAAFESPACWSSPGSGYLRNYVNEPWGPNTGELSVQLAPLVAALWYERARNLPPTVLTRRIAPTLPDFYSAEAGTIHEFTTDPRPARADSETQVGSLMLLAQAAQLGLPQAKSLLRDSLEATIALARRHQYRFPVFFDPNTLNLIGGIEPDCSGVYAYLMLQSYKLFGDPSYLDEARKALAVIDDFGLGYAYELHGTAIGAVACAQMWKITGDRAYLDKSLLPLANVLRNCWLYEPNYGFRKGEHHFFTVSAMPGVYAAPAEQYQAWLALREYDDLVHDDLPASARLLLGEFLKYGPTNIRALYPSYLTPGSIATASERGAKLEPDLLIPIEDLYDPWLLSGRIGQEVYGAGGPLAVAAKTVSAVPEAGLTITSEYPVREQVWNAQRHILRLRFAGFADNATFAGPYKTRVTLRYDAAKAGWSGPISGKETASRPVSKPLRVQIVAGTGQITDRRDEPGCLSFQVEGGTTLLIDAPSPSVAAPKNK